MVTGGTKKDGERSRQDKHGQSRWINWFHVTGWRISTCKEEMMFKMKGRRIQSHPALDDVRSNYKSNLGRAGERTARPPEKASRGMWQQSLERKCSAMKGEDTWAPVVTAVTKHTMTRSGWIMRESAHLRVYIQTQQGHETVLLCFTDNMLLESCLWLCPKVGSKQLLT